ncbi:MAG: GYF domain-containing protein [Bdellovibrio sp.]
MNHKVSWYCHVNLKPQGPLSLQDIRQRIIRGEIGPQDLIFNDNEKTWKPAGEWKNFEPSLFPASQGHDPINGVAMDEAEWVVLIPTGDGKVLQEGPLSVREILEHLARKRISVHQYVWKNGLSGWCQIKDRAEFSNNF